MRFLCGRRIARDGALVLCPNAALCEQVTAVANSLRGPDGAPLCRAVFVSSANPPPFQAPDITVATPGGGPRGAGGGRF